MCGIVGIFSFDKDRNVVPELVKALMDLQNRGQLSAGITTYNENRKRILQTYKDNGKVDDVFRTNHKEKLQHIKNTYAGNIGIGHVRYATSGDDSDTLAQPFERPHGRLSKWFSIAYNGNLANYSSLKSQLESVGYNMTYDSDTEVIMHYLSREMQTKTPTDALNFEDILRKLDGEFDGAWNLCFLNAQGRFFASRDKHGFHPLVYGMTKDYLVVASESSVLDNLQIKSFDVPPGCAISVDMPNKWWHIHKFAEAERKHCFFEYIYFGNSGSKMDDVSLYHTRTAIGEALAQEETEFYDPFDQVVVPVPETSFIAANSYANSLRLPYEQAIIKNHQIGRTFIESTNRRERVRMKFSFIKEVLKGKTVFLVDDSIVRGSTLKELVAILKDWCEVREVHIRIGCPPIIKPCYYGIDFPTEQELYAGSTAPNADDFNADSLHYLTLEGLMNSIRKKENQLCTACITGKYPTPYGLTRINAQ